MTPRPPPPRAAGGRWHWLALTGLLAGLAALGSLWPAAGLDWQPGLAATQPWRCWTPVMVHLSPQHLGLNLGGCVAVAWLGWRANLPPRASAAWALAWPLTHLGLLAQPALAHYGGLSGVLHAGVATIAWQLLAARTRRQRLIGALLAVGGVAKLLSEQPWAGAVQQVPGLDVPLAPGAHLAGVWAGLLACALLAAGARWHARWQAHRRHR